MAAPIGANVGLYMDTRRDLAEGDVIRTAGTGRCYLVLSVRVQRRGRWAGLRKHLRCVVMDPDQVPADATVHPLSWYKR